MLSWLAITRDRYGSTVCARLVFLFQSRGLRYWQGASSVSSGLIENDVARSVQSLGPFERAWMHLQNSPKHCYIYKPKRKLSLKRREMPKPSLGSCSPGTSQGLKEQGTCFNSNAAKGCNGKAASCTILHPVLESLGLPRLHCLFVAMAMRIRNPARLLSNS